ncbi:MAG: hypothetical protein M4579_005350 [Chaenotheca gracillima]|nr:MAG: hypothetical protein M4579_005350 [Chaenotheca gracillima]
MSARPSSSGSSQLLKRRRSRSSDAEVADSSLTTAILRHKDLESSADVDLLRGRKSHGENASIWPDFEAYFSDPSNENRGSDQTQDSLLTQGTESSLTGRDTLRTSPSSVQRPDSIYPAIESKQTVPFASGAWHNQEGVLRTERTGSMMLSPHSPEKNSSTQEHQALRAQAEAKLEQEALLYELKLSRHEDRFGSSQLRHHGEGSTNQDSPPFHASTIPALDAKVTQRQPQQEPPLDRKGTPLDDQAIGFNSSVSQTSKGRYSPEARASTMPKVLVNNLEFHPGRLKDLPQNSPGDLNIRLATGKIKRNERDPLEFRPIHDVRTRSRERAVSSHIGPNRAPKSIGTGWERGFEGPDESKESTDFTRNGLLNFSSRPKVTLNGTGVKKASAGPSPGGPSSTVLPIWRTSKTLHLSDGSGKNLETDLSKIMLEEAARGPFQILDCGLEQSHTKFKDRNLIPFKTLENLGHGSYGRVDKVRSTVTSSVFACKIFTVSSMTKHRFMIMIQKEVEVVKSLQGHLHIVKILATYEAPRSFGVIMTPVADGDLELFLESMAEKNFPSKRFILWKWMLCLANAINYIHARGVRHRDIKPSNILWKGNAIFLTDFGSSHKFTGLTSSTEGYAEGITKLYSAPEMVKEDKRGRSADIFSLGCVFAEMATVIATRSISSFYSSREYAGSHAYHATTDQVEEWFQGLRYPRFALEVIKPMLSFDRSVRPKSSNVITALETFLETSAICTWAPETFGCQCMPPRLSPRSILSKALLDHLELPENLREGVNPFLVREGFFRQQVKPSTLAVVSFDEVLQGALPLQDSLL